MSFLLIWGFKVFVLGTSQYARLCYILVPDNLGFMYYNGEGVPQDDQEAARLYRLAAEQGIALAQYNLGVMYSNGEGVSQDDQEAVRWYRLAAEQGYASAQYNLGFMYAAGKGVPQDYQEAVRDGTAWQPSRGTPPPNTISGSCTPSPRACPRTTSKPTSGLTWLLHKQL